MLEGVDGDKTLARTQIIIQAKNRRKGSGYIMSFSTLSLGGCRFLFEKKILASKIFDKRLKSGAYCFCASSRSNNQVLRRPFQHNTIATQFSKKYNLSFVQQCSKQPHFKQGTKSARKPKVFCIPRWPHLHSRASEERTKLKVTEQQKRVGWRVLN